MEEELAKVEQELLEAQIEIAPARDQALHHISLAAGRIEQAMHEADDAYEITDLALAFIDLQNATQTLRGDVE